MPIKVSCQCGTNLNVPDAAAGKNVKCPKCQKVIAVPGAQPKPATGGKTAQPAKSAVGAKPAAAAKAPDALANLFESAGLKKREGTFCVETKEFGDKRLVEAAEMMRREADTEKRLLSAGMPWWMMFAVILGVLFMMTAILLKMDVKTSGQTSSIAAIAKLQRANYLPVIAFSVGGGAALVALFSLLAISLGAFKESVKQGLLCLLIPPYALYYMFSRMRERKLGNVVMIFCLAAVLAGACLGYSLPKI